MYALGIDIGTTWTAASVWRSGRVETVALGERAHAVPSVVLLEEDGTVVVGEAAARRRASSVDRVAERFKLDFGTGVPVPIAGKIRSVPQLTTDLVRWVHERVCEREGSSPARVVVTVPAGWRHRRRDLMLSCATEAGLTEGSVSLLAEPVAAAVHYAGNERVRAGALIGVFDLGGGTFDATVLSKTPTGFEIVGRPQGTGEAGHQSALEALGGIEMDRAMLAAVIEELGPIWTSLDDQKTQVRAAKAALLDELVQAKEALSASRSTVLSVMLPGVTTELPFTRAELEERVRPLVTDTVDFFERAVRDSGVTLSDLDRVLMVGGASRMPIVQALVRERFALPLSVDQHPKYAVCLGAAIAAGSQLEGTRETAPSAEQPTEDRPTHVDHLEPTEAGVAIVVDLETSGLGAASEVPLRPAVERWRPTPTPHVAAEEFVVRPDADYAEQVRRAAVRIVAVVAAVLLVVVVVALLARG